MSEQTPVPESEQGNEEATSRATGLQKIKQKLQPVWQQAGQAARYLLLEEIAIVLVVVLLLLYYLMPENAWAYVQHLFSATVKHAGESQLPQSISAANQAFLKQAEALAVHDFLLLTEVSAILDVVQSSQIGISFIADFNVTVGHAISELNQGSKRALEVNMLSAALIKLIALIARFCSYIASGIYIILLWVWLLYLLLLRLRSVSQVPDKVVKGAQVIANEVLVIFLVVYLFIPYSIHLSSVTSYYLHHQVKTDNSQKVKAIHSAIYSGVDQSKLKDKAQTSISHLKKISASDLHYKVENLFSYLLQAIAITLFDLLLMPFIVLYGLYRIFRRSVLLEIQHYLKA